MPSTRSAYLDMNDGSGRTLALDDPATGYVCSELDLGYPAPRENTSNRPDMPGVDDQTTYPGARAVTANISAWGEGLTTDEIFRLFAPYLALPARPVLRYRLATSDGQDQPERMLTLRPSSWAGPMNQPVNGQLQLGWSAPDPIAYDPDLKTAQAWPAEAQFGGRTYPLTYPRSYPPLVGQGLEARLHPAGDYPVSPVIRMYGPGDNPYVQFATGGIASFAIYLDVNLDDGDYVEVDMAAQTATLYDASAATLTDAMGLLDWTVTTWKALPPAVDTWAAYNAGNASTSTMAVISWREGYLA